MRIVQSLKQTCELLQLPKSPHQSLQIYLLGNWEQDILNKWKGKIYYMGNNYNILFAFKLTRLLFS